MSKKMNNQETSNIALLEGNKYLKLSKSDNYIIFEVIEIEYTKKKYWYTEYKEKRLKKNASSSIYITNYKFLEMLDKDTFEFESLSYVKTYHYNSKFSFNFVKVNKTNDCLIETFYGMKKSELIEFYYSSNKSIYLKNEVEKIGKVKIDILAQQTIKKMRTDDKSTYNQLFMSINRLQNGCNTLKIFNDYNVNDFYFVKLNEQDQKIYNGGIIKRTSDKKEIENKKPAFYYSIHT